MTVDNLIHPLIAERSSLNVLILQTVSKSLAMHQSRSGLCKVRNRVQDGIQLAAYIYNMAAFY